MTRMLLLLFIGLIHLVFSQTTFEELNVDLREVLQEEFNGGILNDLIGHTVRLIFHDCGGPQEGDDPNEISRCDGCIQFSNAFNHAGLEGFAVDALDEIYIGNGWIDKMSRADFWAISATIAIQFAFELDENENDELPNIPFHIGREDCSASPDVDADNTEIKLFPNAILGWDHVQDWFDTNMGWTDQEIVAILGAHTLGRTHSDASGFTTGPWVVDWQKLNNQFYVDLINIPWVQDIAEANDKWEWERNDFFYMLNTDMCLFFDIDDFLDTETGEVACDWISFGDIENNDILNTSCPTNDQTIDFVEEYATDNQAWLNDFVAVFRQLILTGYDVDDLEEITEEPTGTDTENESGVVWKHFNVLPLVVLVVSIWFVI